ncbi:MAG: sigma-70 family RNA polymerase sigma factor [Herbaspirillum huttiense]|uniref:RNA polymerase sigma factor n=1 Tax=Herbaspirillum huttiense TaxID=863372 RepID=UPI001AD16331|nr:sigma-70 family RNA polymerase sigma factor [Herbaspirillum huttiense]MBN9359521.1 sigma-70 family RNA polymerase sigma factor [Herbaspirillum huttiense]
MSGPSFNSIEQEEIDLLDRISQGDRRAFERLYRHYFPRLAQFLRRLVRDGQLSEEIINDTMYVVWTKAHTYNGQSRVSTWIFAIAYRQGLKALSRVDTPVEMDQESMVADEFEEPDKQLSEAQLRRHIGGALDRLSFEHRTVMALTYFHGMSYDEIAHTMGCSINTVKTRMFYARQKLKVFLSAYA